MGVPEATHEWVHRSATINGVRLHYVAAGEGPLVLLLHGFPEFWYAWRWQIPALAAAGFRVIAPDLRGYNLSDKPKGVSSYRVSTIARDVVELIRHAGAERAAVVGHDWGGVVAWYLGANHAEVVEKLVVLNAPHPAAYARELKNPVQLLRSSYALFFQLPGLPEALLRAGNFAILRRMLRTQPTRPDAFTAEDLRRYREAWAQPSAFTASINYYRAAARSIFHSLHQTERILAPTLLIWGERDRYLGVRLSRGLERWVPDLRVERLPNASHWIMSDAPERVNHLMIDFLRAD